MLFMNIYVHFESASQKQKEFLHLLYNHNIISLSYLSPFWK